MGLGPKATDVPGRLVELASGVDALYLSGRAVVPPALIEKLEGLRSEAAEAGRPSSIGLGEEVTVQGHGWGKYRYCLQHRYGRIGISPSRSLPPIRIQPRTEFLHGVGPLSAVSWFEELLWDSVGPVRFSVNRLDLHSDWQGWQLDGDDRSRFVCRADRRDLHEEGARFTGFEFGRRATKTICCRIYDKSVQQEREGTDFWLDLWGERHDRSIPVLRVEFELGRQGLREFGVDTPDEAVEAAGALWAHVTSDWLSYRTPGDDATRARWPVAPEWAQIQRASIASEAAGLTRMYEGRRRGSLRTLMPILNGCMASFAALIGASSIEEACAALPGFLHEYEDRTRQAFGDRVAAKLREAVA